MNFNCWSRGDIILSSLIFRIIDYNSDDYSISNIKLKYDKTVNLTPETLHSKGSLQDVAVDLPQGNPVPSTWSRHDKFSRDIKLENIMILMKWDHFRLLRIYSSILNCAVAAGGKPVIWAEKKKRVD